VDKHLSGDSAKVINFTMDEAASMADYNDCDIQECCECADCCTQLKVDEMIGVISDPDGMFVYCNLCMADMLDIEIQQTDDYDSELHIMREKLR